MAVHGDVEQALVLPSIFLVDAHADQVGHDFGEPMIVIAFHPNHLHSSLGVGKLADEAEELPVLFLEAAEIQVGKNIAQQDESAIGVFAAAREAPRAPGSYRRRGAGPTKSACRKTVAATISIVLKKCYGVMN